MFHQIMLIIRGMFINLYDINRWSFKKSETLSAPIRTSRRRNSRVVLRPDTRIYQFGVKKITIRDQIILVVLFCLLRET